MKDFVIWNVLKYESWFKKFTVQNMERNGGWGKASNSAGVNTAVAGTRGGQVEVAAGSSIEKSGFNTGKKDRKVFF